MNLRITAFVTASTLAHGGVALWLTANPAPRLTVGGEARALSIVLLPAAQATDHSVVATRPTQTVVPTPDQRATAHDTPHARIAETNSNTAQDTKPQTAAVTDTLASNHNAATPQHSAAENVSEHVSAALKNQLAHNFVYPWLARQRGWQGRVLLSLHVASNGDLSDWKVVGTSGYRTLDQSALKAAQRIDHLPQAEHWLKGESVEVRLPVQYKLLDS